MSAPNQRRDFRIAVDVPFFQGHFHEIFSGVLDYCAEHPEVLPMNFLGKAAVVRGLGDISQIDGLVLAASAPPVVERLLELKRRVVLVSCRFAQRLTSEVVPDNEAVGRSAAAFFLERRYRHFAFLGFSDLRFSFARGRGYRRALGKEGFRTEVFTLAARPGPEGVYAKEYRNLERWIAALPRPAGLYAANDALARNAILAASASGIRVPEDLAVLGTDNDPMPFGLTPMPIASVSLNSRRIGRAAAELLHRHLLARRPGFESIVIEPGAIVVRRSADALGVDQPILSKALRFMEESFAEKLTAVTIARAAGCSRRSLDQQFRAVLDTTVAERLRSIRLTHARRMLETTDWTLERVSAACGILDAGKFIRYFREAYGTTPGELRKTSAAAGTGRCLPPGRQE